ncbi:MAG: type III-A CRISPR-associated RAMP protein Csm5 [Bacteroidetes bacterium]|nr:type III-A CRISPR-associated RAMP protein Csm5 [Bacteroidota bacterium]
MARTLYLTTLTPVHIGTGNKLQPFDYVVLDSVFHKIDADEVFRTLYEKYPHAADQLLEWIDDTSKEFEKYEKSNKQASQAKKDFTLLSYIEKKINDKELLQTIKNHLKNEEKYVVYSMEYAPTLKRKMEIQEGVKTGSHELYIPGSSLKGALRTILLSSALQNSSSEKKKELSKKIVNKLAGPENIEKLKTKIGTILEEEFFFCGAVDRNGRPIIGDAKYDLMKLLHISDSTSLPSREAGSISTIDLYLKNGKEPQRQAPAVEAIRAGKEFKVTVSFDVEFLFTASSLLQKNDPCFGKTEWIDIEEKVQTLFNLNLRTIEKYTKDELEEFLLSNLLEKINNVSKEMREKEAEWAQVVSENSKSEYKNKAAIMLKFYEQLPPQSIKVGYSSGFYATTLFLPMSHSPELRETEKSLLEKFKIGKTADRRPAAVTKEFSMEKFPTSRRFETQTESISPMGWIAVTAEPLKEAPLLENISLRRETTITVQPNEITAIILEIKSARAALGKIENKEFAGSEVEIRGAHFQNLGITKGSRIVVEVKTQNKKLQSVNFRKKIS